MRLKVLCTGDAVGSSGRRALATAIPALVEEHDIACTVANCENVASGSGITPALYAKLIKSGVDVITLGDHIYRRREFIPILETSDRVVKPANLPSAAPGREFTVFETASGHKVAVVCLLGRLYMKTMADCPFKAAERILAKIPGDVKIKIFDIHAEATSEKVALGWFLDGKASVVFGTHTHVPTADARILNGGTGYITDLGMSGPYDSVLGRNKENVLQAMTTSIPTRFEVATGDPRVSGIIAEINCESGRCVAIESVQVKTPEEC